MQNKELRFGSFIFGPVVMRMFYVANLPKEALMVKMFCNLLSIYVIHLSYPEIEIIKVLMVSLTDTEIIY